jgi:GDP/UDP-N,N'-diacetylbacillosamine 2-epimerase (hydrolysing)
LGTVRYFSLIKSVDVVLGNSSSGIIEVPSFKKPTVNIGDRQKGRIMASSVINCKPNRSSIYGALRKALSEDFKNVSRKTKNPYGDGKTTERIIRIIGRNIDHINNTTKIFEDIQNV